MLKVLVIVLTALKVTGTELVPFSIKYCWAAAPSNRPSLITVFSIELMRTFWNAGIAMAARRPMMTTTIMISTRVKPWFERDVFMFLFIGIFVALLFEELF